MHSDSLMPTAIKIVGVCDANQCLKMRWLVIFFFLIHWFSRLRLCYYLIVFQHILMSLSRSYALLCF